MGLQLKASLIFRRIYFAFLTRICRYALFFFTFFIHANENVKYVGSLLSDPPTAIPLGHFVIRNFFSFDDLKNIYQEDWKSVSRKDSYNSIQYRLQCFFGLNDSFDVSLSSRVYFNSKGRYAYSSVGDLIAGLDFQLLDDERFTFLPGIKFAVREVFPFGNYQLFNPKRGYMEKSGSGCFSTELALFFYKKFLIASNWFISTTINVQYQINSWVTMKGFHAYGGGFGTNGKLLVGNAWQSLLNVQFIYKNALFLSLDTLYEHHDSSNFYGYPGINFYGKYCDPDQPSFERVSLAPSITYLFRSQVGIMLGGWLSFCGRNIEQIRQYIANVFYIF